MKNMQSQNSRFLHTIYCLCRVAALFSLCVFGFFFVSCKKKIDYFTYVSELRNNIFLAQTETLSLRIYSLTKETPYVADGIPKETTTLTEVYLTAPSGDKTCNLTFEINGKNYGGEMSYDNVKAEYYFSCTLDVSALSKIPCHITYGEISTDIDALSVLTENTLSPQKILNILLDYDGELFQTMTDKYGFAGEIYLRLIYEDSPYYYVGIIDRNGGVHAFLINAQSGKVLARRQS